MVIIKDDDLKDNNYVSKYLIYVLMVFISIGIIVGFIFILEHGILLDKIEQMGNEHYELLNFLEKDLDKDMNVSNNNSEKLDKLLSLLQKQ